MHLKRRRKTKVGLSRKLRLARQVRGRRMRWAGPSNRREAVLHLFSEHLHTSLLTRGRNFNWENFYY